MEPFEIISLIIGIIGMVSQGIANQQNIQNAEENREDTQIFNAEQAELAHQREIDKYHTLYAPEARVEQLHKAGLSPGLIYSGTGISGTSTTGAQANASAAAIPTINPIADIQGLMQALTGAEQAAKTKEEVERTTEETNNLKQVNENLKEELKNLAQERVESQQRIDNMAQQLKNSKLQETTLQLQNDMLRIDKDIAAATKDDKEQAIRDGANLLSQSLEKGMHEIEILEADAATEKELRQAVINNYKASMKELGARAALEAQQEVESYVKGWLGVTEMREMKEKINLYKTQGKLNDAKVEEINKLIEKYNADIQLITQEYQTEIANTQLRNKEAYWYGVKAAAEVTEKYTAAAKNICQGFESVMGATKPKGGGITINTK